MYGSVADVEALLAPTPLAELSAETGVVADDAVIEAVLGQASGFLDQRIGSRYVTPVTGPASALAKLATAAAAIGCYLLFARRLGKDAEKALKTGFDKALEWSTFVGQGTMALPGAELYSESVTPVTAEAGITEGYGYLSRTRVYGPGTAL